MPVQRASAAEQIANELRAQIESGEYKPGEALPSDMDLARRFDVSKPTVTKARAMLVALRLVESRAGAASIVRDVSRDPVPAGNRIQRARRTGRVYPEGHYARILSAKTIPAPPEVAAAIGVSEGSSIIERTRVTYDADAAALSTSVTYFPSELAEACPALLETDRLEQGTTVYVEQQTGRRAGSVASTVWCQPADAGAGGNLAELQLPAAAYALAISTTTYDEAGEVIAYEIELHPPDTPIALDVTGV